MMVASDWKEAGNGEVRCNKYNGYFICILCIVTLFVHCIYLLIFYLLHKYISPMKVRNSVFQTISIAYNRD